MGTAIIKEEPKRMDIAINPEALIAKGIESGDAPCSHGVPPPVR